MKGLFDIPFMQAVLANFHVELRGIRHIQIFNSVDSVALRSRDPEEPRTARTMVVERYDRLMILQENLPRTIQSAWSKLSKNFHSVDSVASCGSRDPNEPSRNDICMH
jgi:hypothetical protein